MTSSVVSQKGCEMSQGLISSPRTESSFDHWEVHPRVWDNGLQANNDKLFLQRDRKGETGFTI